MNMAIKGAKKGIDWEGVDWSRQDVEIALEVGCTREAVRQKRPEGVRADRYRKHTLPTVVDVIVGMETVGMSLEEVARRASCSKKHALKVLLDLGKEYARLPKGNSKYDWGKFPDNWKEFTDRELAVVIGVGNPSVVTQWRVRHGYRKNGEV